MADDTTYSYTSPSEDDANKKREEQAKRERDIATESLKLANERVDALREELGLRTTVTSEQSTQLSLTKQVAKEALNYIGKQNEGFRDAKSLNKDLNKATALSNKLKAVNNNELTGANRITKDTLDLQDEIVAKLQKEYDNAVAVEEAMGLTGKSLSVVNKLLGNSISDIDEVLKKTKERIQILQEEEKLLPGLAGKMQGFGISISEVGKSIGKNLNDPMTYLMILLENSTAVNKFQKELGVSYGQALKLQGEMALIAVSSGDVFINSKKISEAFSTMNQELGFIVDYSGQTLETMVNLEKRLGLASGEAAKLTMLFKLQGDNTEETASNLADSLNSQIKSGNVALSAKQIFNEIAKTSAVIQVSLGGTAEEIGTAVIAAKQLGAELADIDQIAGSVLNFEQSIENELQAELLTGKQLNLERARLLALNNDLAGVADEIAAQGIDYNFMTTANRLEQEAVAEALGLSRDRLASIVQQQEFQNMSAEEVKNQYGDQAYENFKALDAQQKFNEAVTKLKGILSDVMVILTPLIDGVALLADFASGIGGAFTAIGLTIGGMIPMVKRLGVLLRYMQIKSIGTAIANMFAGLVRTMGPLGIGAAIGATAGMLALIATSANVYDAMYGDNQLVTKDKGVINFNNQDAILLAGTNLAGGEKIDYDKISSTVSETIKPEKFDYDKISSTVSETVKPEKFDYDKMSSVVKSQPIETTVSPITPQPIIPAPNITVEKDTEKFDYDKMASAMSKVQISTSTKYDSFRAKSQAANHGSYQRNARHQTKFT